MALLDALWDDGRELDGLWHPGAYLAIKERGMRGVPSPRDEAFVRRVLVEVAAADAGAREQASRATGLPCRPRAHPRRHPASPDPMEPVEGGRAYRRVPGRCAGCGCPHDDRTSGCANCNSRFAMRRKGARAAA